MKPKEYILFILLIFIPNYNWAQSNYAQKNPFQNEYFIKNNGQWNKSFIDFAYWSGIENIHIKNKGIGFIWKTIASNGETTDSLDFTLLNTIKNPIIETENNSLHYWTFGESRFNSIGFKRIIYRQIYPKIDVVYEIGNPIQGLIKYSFILHPGADVKSIKIKYNIKSNKESIPDCIHLISNNFEYIDSGLNATYLNEKEEIPIHYSIKNNIVSFQFESKPIHRTIIIDPYVKKVSILNKDPYHNSKYSDLSNLITMSQFDIDNNLYIMSACYWFPQIAKFDNKGNLIWIFSGQIPSLNWYTADKIFNRPPFAFFVIDRFKKKVFVGRNTSTDPYKIIRLNDSGNFDNFKSYTQFSSRIYISSLNLDCHLDGILATGSLSIANIENYTLLGIDKNIDSVPLKKISVSKDSISTLPMGYKTLIDENGELFQFFQYQKQVYFFDSIQQVWKYKSLFPRKNFLVKLASNYSDTLWMKEIPTNLIKFSQVSNFPNLSGLDETNTSHNNCLAMNKKIIFIYDGKVMVAVNKSNGNILTIDSIYYHQGIRGHLGQSGIAVDDCDHVYLGGDSSNVHLYNFIGNKFIFDTTFQFIKNTNGSTIDIQLNKFSNTLFVSGDSFIAATNNITTCYNSNFSVDTIYTPWCEGKYSAVVKSGDSTKNYTFIWKKRKKGTDEILKIQTLKKGSYDTLLNFKLSDTIELTVTQNINCNGEFKKFIFKPNYRDTNTVNINLCRNQIFHLRARQFDKDTIFTDQLLNSVKCDSIVTYILKFYPIKFDTIIYNVCNGDSITIGKKIYSKSLQFNDTFIQYNGCDSIVTRNIIINDNRIKNTFNICQNDSIKIGKHSYSNSGIYYDTLKSIRNCDSLIETIIVKHKDTLVQFKYNLCFGDTFRKSGKYFTKSTEVIDSFYNQWGCDSVIKYKIIFHPKQNTSIIKSLCKNDIYNYKGKNYLPPAIIYDTLTNIFGCDSFVKIEIIPRSVKAVFNTDTSNNPTIQFTNTSINDVRFIWYINDEPIDSTNKTLTQTFENKKDQTINVCLEIIDSLNCRDTFCSKINIYALNFWIYNVFTPNQDRFNDLNKIGFSGKPFNYSIYIYNRWGSLVFQSENSSISDSSKFWNGKVMNNGEECPSGSYFAIYHFYTNGTQNPPRVIQAALELIR